MMGYPTKMTRHKCANKILESHVGTLNVHKNMIFIFKIVSE